MNPNQPQPNNTPPNGVDNAYAPQDNEAQGETLVIDKRSMETVTNPDCVHEYVKDPTDETPEYFAEVCRWCPIGRLVKKV